MRKGLRYSDSICILHRANRKRDMLLMSFTSVLELICTTANWNLDGEKGAKMNECNEDWCFSQECLGDQVVLNYIQYTLNSYT